MEECTRILQPMSNRTRRIVVTGGAGFVGSHLLDRLLGCPGNDSVVVFDNLSRGRLSNIAQHQTHPRLEFIEGDIRDPRAVLEAMAGATLVYHLAAQPSVLEAVTNAESTFTTNVVGTFNVLRAAKTAGVDRVVFASSRQVYGEPISLPVD